MSAHCVSVKVMRIKVTSHLATLNHYEVEMGILKRQQTLGHVDKWRSQRRIDVMSMKPRKLSAVLS